MDFKEAAYNVLKKEKRPLSIKEITQIVLKAGLIKSIGKTPIATIGSMIYTAYIFYASREKPII